MADFVFKVGGGFFLWVGFGGVVGFGVGREFGEGEVVVGEAFAGLGAGVLPFFEEGFGEFWGGFGLFGVVLAVEEG